MRRIVSLKHDNCVFRYHRDTKLFSIEDYSDEDKVVETVLHISDVKAFVKFLLDMLIP